MRSKLAAEWEAMGWEWDLQIGGLILDRVAEAGAVDSDALAGALPGSYLVRYGASREDISSSISRAIGGETLDAESAERSTVSVIVSGDSYTLNFGNNARIENSAVNVGRGAQIKIDATADRNDLINALSVLVASGLAGRWDERAAHAIGGAIEEKDLLSLEDVRAAVVGAGQEAGVDASGIQELLEKVAVGGLGSFLATGLSSGLTDLLHLVG